MSSASEAVDVLTDDFYYSVPIDDSKNMTANIELVNNYISHGKKLLVKYGDRWPPKKIGYCTGTYANGFIVDGHHWNFAIPISKKYGRILRFFVAFKEFKRRHTLQVMWAQITLAASVATLSLVLGIKISPWLLFGIAVCVPFLLGHIILLKLIDKN